MRALEAVGVDEPGVVLLRAARDLLGGRVTRVDPGNHPQQPTSGSCPAAQPVTTTSCRIRSRSFPTC